MLVKTILPIILFVALLGIKTSVAQKKLENVIPKEDIKKIEKARRLFNEYKIFQGEKILKDLVKQHPNEVYYHEALIQLQYQVLQRIKPAYEEYSALLPDMDTTANHLDSQESDSTESKIALPKGGVTYDNISTFSGLDRGEETSEPEKKGAKKNKKKRAKDEDSSITEAVVTIDPTLVSNDEDSNPIDEQKEKETKALREKLKHLEELAQIPYESYKQELINNARLATRILPNADSASFYLRKLLVDTIDANAQLPEDAQHFFEDAMDDYRQRDVIKAARNIEKALRIAPNYYEANLILGELYQIMNNDTGAIRVYKKSIELQPLRPEAWGELSTLYYNKGMYIEASTAVIEGIMVYPHAHYFELLRKILLKTGRVFNSQWLKREVYPASTATYEEIIVNDKSPWWHYQAAEQEVHSYFDTIGLVKPNEKTRERYLEVYCWKKMLNNSSKKYFGFARAMEQLGYLDCYVLISLFHQDLYGQFSDFSINQFEKIKDYFYILINWDDKKFDKVRKLVAPPPEPNNNEKTKTEVKPK